MKSLVLAAAAVAAIGLAGCKKPGTDTADGDTAAARGRYLGVGVYSASSLWSKMVSANTATDPAKAGLRDDEHVIVVVDSRTGEIRQCGDLSGYCIGMNPWSGPLDATRAAPVRLTEHAEPTHADDAPSAAEPAASSAPAPQGPKP